MKKKYLKKIYIKKQKGFSLIEMMVVVCILGLIILGLVTFFTGGARSWISGQSQLEAQRNARQAMDIMVREIREGKSVSSGTPTSITVNIPALGSDPAGSVTYTWAGTPGSPINREGNPLIDNVKTVSFLSTDPSKVHIILEVDVDADGNPDITLDTDVNLRNYGL
jgi:prepilin-type N-terminal cleavage/methylation domain-containing protein